ncbi:MAG: protein methyltransferase [Halomonas sp.]|nr:50S ribosomal protein L11 methyltransferase [Halomonas sp.]TVP49260.1 MAG: protein methyltransferase [Halomonas sp.]
MELANYSDWSIDRLSEQNLFLDNKRKFPSWHYAMMNDKSRNEAIYSSIRSLDLKNKSVLEIGTGAGLVAMYFARCGAKHVYTCEMDKQLCEIAKQNIKHNNLEDKITVYNMSSTYLIDSNILNLTPDVIFTETLDCGIIGEGYERVAADIKKIATQETIILPEIIKQYGFLVESTDINEQNIANNEKMGAGLNLELINRYSTFTYFPVRYKNYKARTLTDVAEIGTYNYKDSFKKNKKIRIKAYRSGTCHGLITYFHAKFGNHSVTNDVRDNGHWHQAFHPFLNAVNLVAGNDYLLGISAKGYVTLTSLGGQNEC